MMPLFPKEPKPQNSGRAPLFDRLCGSDMWLNEAETKRSIAQEIRRILSARSMSNTWRKNPGRGTRVMAWNELLTHDPKADKYIIEREITRRIQRLEPRLNNIKIALKKHSHERYIVSIQGMFRVTPQHPPSSFSTTIDYTPTS